MGVFSIGESCGLEFFSLVKEAMCYRNTSLRTSCSFSFFDGVNQMKRGFVMNSQLLVCHCHLLALKKKIKLSEWNESECWSLRVWRPNISQAPLQTWTCQYFIMQHFKRLHKCCQWSGKGSFITGLTTFKVTLHKSLYQETLDGDKTRWNTGAFAN